MRRNENRVVRGSRRLAMGLAAALWIGALCGSAGGAEPSLRLVEPASGRGVVVEPGAPLLHVVFFATWCSPCLDELDRLTDLEARWHERGYRLVLVAVQTRHTADRLTHFRAGRRLPGEFLFDATGEAQRTLRAEQLPTHVLLDPSGRELLRTTAFGERIESVLSERLAQRQRGPRR